jgi:hypothetical protein
MRRPLKVLGILALVATAFAAGVVFNVLRNRDGTVRARIVNQMQEPIQSFTLRYTTCGSELQISGRVLPAGKSQIVRYNVCGEGGYLVEVTLADGRVLKGKEGYVESGYSTVDTVTPKGIDSEQSTYAL